MNNDSIPTAMVYYVPGRDIIFPVNSSFWDFHSLYRSVGIYTDEMADLIKDAKMMQYGSVSNFTMPCVSCAAETTCAFAEEGISLADMDENEAYAFATALCAGCYGLGKPIELNMTPDRFTDLCETTFNKLAVEEHSVTHTVALYATYHIGQRFGRLSERVKKALCHNTIHEPNVVPHISELELAGHLDELIEVCQKWKYFLEKGETDPLSKAYINGLRHNFFDYEMERIQLTLGLMGESQEIAEQTLGQILKIEPAEKDNGHALKKELGDMLYYLLMLIRRSCFTFEYVAWAVRLKLLKKYKGKFSAERSQIKA